MDLIKSSIKIIKENQTKNGAYLASPNLNLYKYCWFRDGAWIAYSMLISGEYTSAEKFFDWSSYVINKNKIKITNAIKRLEKNLPLEDNFIHARYDFNGNEVDFNWSDFQHDGLGVWLWSLSEYIKLVGKNKEEWIIAAKLICIYLKIIWKIPCCDLWEENCDKINTETLGSIYFGLSSFSNFFPEYKLDKTCREIKDFIINNNISNGILVKYTGSKDIDSSLIMCSIPFNVIFKDDPIIKKTINKINKELKVTYGLRRYKDDKFYGGGEWLILGCFLGLYYAKIGNVEEAKNILNWIENQSDKNNFLPEQVNPIDNGEYLKWKKLWGNPAKPLVWSHAMYLILRNELSNIRHN